MVVTDLRVIVADSERDALRECHAIGSGDVVSVGVDWTMGRDTNDRFVQLCKRRQQVSHMPCNDDKVVQDVRVLQASDCPNTQQWRTLYTPRDGVVVCIKDTTVEQAKQTGEYVVDIDTTLGRFYNDALPGWTTLRDTSIHEWRDDSEDAAYAGVYISVRRPLRPITAVSLVSTSGSDASSVLTACGDAFASGVFTSATGQSQVLCTSQSPSTPPNTTDRSLVGVRVTTDADDCSSVPLSSSLRLTQRQVLCLDWEEGVNASSSGAFVYELSFAQPPAEIPSDAAFVNALTQSGYNRVASIGGAALVTRAYDHATVLAVDDEANPSRPPLRAKYNQSSRSLSFKILQLADLHFSGDAATECRDSGGIDDCTEVIMTEYVNEVLDVEKPDFVVLTGDNVQTSSIEFHQLAVDAATATLEQRGVPYALVFGNHDDEAQLSRAKQLDLLRAKPYSYTQRGPSAVAGVSNFHLDVQAPHKGPWGGEGDNVFRMYFVDSLSYPNKETYPFTASYYDWIRPSQVQYYEQLSQAERVPAALMFFHIPLPEYAAAPWEGRVVAGDRKEPVMAAHVNSHLFSSLVDRNEVKATFVGHDHTNDYCYKREGVQLCYGGGAGFGRAYGNDRIARRSRVIEWTVDGSDVRQIHTWLRLHGDVSSKHGEQLLYTDVNSNAAVQIVHDSRGENDTILFVTLGGGVGLIVVIVAAWFEQRRMKQLSARSNLVLTPETKQDPFV